jgi:Ca2+-binding EF-hand superfamily protein
MKRTALFISLLSITAASWGQTPPAANEERRSGPSREQMEQRREQMKQRFDAAFKKADTDGDGALSRAEVEKAMPRMAKDFDAIDGNKDGKITQDEIRARMQARMAERRKDHGKGGPDGAGPGADRREQGKKRFEEQFKKADTDGDGALSRAEVEKAMPRMARDFDAIDGNKDGKVTPDEIRTHMQARMAERRKGSARSDAPKPQ